ncbi:MAG TPA: VIT1/CCC1 transporter family protein [Xanthobacteraceae bacterium]|jgi:VIT1/CCC1 family predicted Fe2+/Mn2+ transporter
MNIGPSLQRLRGSFNNSVGTIVFGMEDGTVSIFGLIFGVAATTNSTKTVLIAGACGAAAAAVSMMAGAYLDAETTRDEANAARSPVAPPHSAVSLLARLANMGLPSQQCDALARVVQNDRDAMDGLLLALQGAPKALLNPFEQALWMLLADFLAAAVPILPFVFLPILQARVVSGAVTVALLIGLGVGRAQIAKRSTIRTILETVSIGVAAALAGVAISILVDRLFS